MPRIDPGAPLPITEELRPSDLPEIIEALETIEANDKTVYDYNGRHAFNRDGRLPDSGRWLTPREIAHRLLKELR